MLFAQCRCYFCSPRPRKAPKWLVCGRRGCAGGGRRRCGTPEYERMGRDWVSVGSEFGVTEATMQ